VAGRLVGWIADPTMVMFNLESMQLKDQNTVRDQSLIFCTTVRTLAAEQTLVPAAARLDIGHRNKGLGAHAFTVALGAKTRSLNCLHWA
jgi:hypothetical protein